MILKMEASVEDPIAIPNAEDEGWKTFTLTYVEYPKDDYFGKVLAILSLSPLIIVIMFRSLGHVLALFLLMVTGYAHSRLSIFFLVVLFKQFT